MTKRSWGAAVLALLTVGAASAQEGSGKAMTVTTEGIIARMDHNGDGKIGYEEFRNAMMRRYDHADRNHDQVLQGDEIPQHSVTMAQSQDAQGAVTLETFSGSLRTVFDSFDANHDGVLDKDETGAFAQARKNVQGDTP
jgi:hypothetical protein